MAGGGALLAGAVPSAVEGGSDPAIGVEVEAVWLAVIALETCAVCEALVLLAGDCFCSFAMVALASRSWVSSSTMRAVESPCDEYQRPAERPMKARVVSANRKVSLFMSRVVGGREFEHADEEMSKKGRWQRQKAELSA